MSRPGPVELDMIRWRHSIQVGRIDIYGAGHAQTIGDVGALIAEVDALTAERDTAVQRLEAGVRDLARARGVHPDVIRVALGLHNPSTLCDTEQQQHVVGGRPA